jgi:class I fructose-bisphosphate aldolase
LNTGGYKAIRIGDSGYGKLDECIYSELSSDRAIDLSRHHVANGYMGRVGLINSGGASGENDIAEAVRTAVINKRAGGVELLSGRKAFQKPIDDVIASLNAIQDIYLNEHVTIA